ncbi:MAG: 30S ribosomal protein S16 [Bacteroidales bacterium]|jgi:small subunit ribosomal protein S16
MAVKIRLQRYGKKGQPFYHIVIADARAARDGKFIEKIGTYNPITVPATIEINIESACKWLKDGAQPTDTARAILSYKGVMIKRHLQIGVEKGAITQEVADTKFNAWLIEKENKILAKKEEKRNSKKTDAKKAIAAEMEFNAKRAEAISKKRTDAEAVIAAEAAAKAKAKADAEAERAPKAEVVETPVEEAPVAESSVEADAPTAE